MEPTAKLRQAVQDYKSGKSEAFDILYYESEKYVYTCIYKVMCGNDNVYDATEEILQNTYLEISRSISQLENDDRFLQWAGMIATRKCYAYIKQNKKYVLLAEENDTFDTLADDDNLIPESILQDREKQRLLREIIDTELTDMQKLCIIAFYYNGQKQADIAKELGIPENTVKTNLSRAKAKMKEGILGIEKRDGIRLHSVAPFLLLLFTEDVQAAAVPPEISQNVLTSVSAVAGTTATVGGTATVGTTTANAVASTGKAVAVSLKAKMIGGIVGAGLLATVGGSIYFGNQVTKEKTWETVYKGYIMSNEELVGFDLNDFDHDGIPELVAKTTKGGVDVYRVENESIIRVRALLGPYTLDGQTWVENVDGCRIGYGLEDDEMITLRTGTGIRKDNGEEYYLTHHNLFKYENNHLDPVGYDQTTIEAQFCTIHFSEIEEGEIERRFKEFKKHGNRERIGNEAGMNEENSSQNDDEFLEGQQSSNEDSIDNEIEDNGKNTKEEVMQEKEVTPEERENFRILAQYMTATRWGEDLAGAQIVPTQQNVCDFIGRVASDNFEYEQWAYDKYLPTRVGEVAYTEVYTGESIKEYAKNVFGLELSTIQEGCLRLENGNYMAMDAQFESGDLCEITKVMTDGESYLVTGTNAFGEYQDIYSLEPTYIASYNFTMKLTQNENSPFGFTLKEITYENTEEIALGDAQYEMILEMERAAEIACISHWQMSDNFIITPTQMTVGSKLEYAAQGYRFGWANQPMEQVSIEELSQMLEQVIGVSLSREEVDETFQEMQSGSYIYKGTAYQDGIVDLYVRLEAFYGSDVEQRYDISQNEYTYQNKTLLYSSSNTDVNHIENMIKVGNQLVVYGVSDTYDVPFAMHLYEDANSPTGYKLDYIYYFISMSSLGQNG